jgi:UDP-glucose 4-epimerase
MRVLLTGNRGKVGQVTEAWLRSLGDEVVGFDLVDGFDVLDKKALDERIRACRAVVHLAIANLPEDVYADEVYETDVLGTWNVLRAAADAGIKRVVFMSSVNALGVFKREARPDYLPIDDEHPARPRSAYGLSKLLSEETCRYFSTRDGMTTICLRPPAVWEPEDYPKQLVNWRANPRSELADWEYGAFIDGRDLADAVSRALRVPLQGHARLLVCAPDIASLGKSGRELAKQLMPEVEWRGGEAYEKEPMRSLLDTRRAFEVLGWTPTYSWQAFVESEEGKVLASRPVPAPSIMTRLRSLGERLGLRR